MISYLNLNQSQEELNKIYDDEYYWYLKSPQFCEQMHKVVGEIVNSFRQSCLDVGCGEGWLSDYVRVPYTGIDGSCVAIIRALHKNSKNRFFVDRFEKPHLRGYFPTVIFSGILQVLVKPKWRRFLLDEYVNLFGVKQFVVCDLEMADLSDLEAHYDPILKQSIEITGINLEPEVKRFRKILVLKCR